MTKLNLELRWRWPRLVQKEEASLWAAGQMGTDWPISIAQQWLCVDSTFQLAPAPWVICRAHKQRIVQCIQVPLALARDHGYEWDLCVPVVRPSHTSPTSAWTERRLASVGCLTHLQSHFRGLKMSFHKGEEEMGVKSHRKAVPWGRKPRRLL